MNNIFVIDVGNTLIKIAYVNISKFKIISKELYETKNIESLKIEINKQLNEDFNATIFLCSVAPKKLKELIKIINKNHLINIIKNDFYKKIVRDEFNINEIGLDILSSSYESLKIYEKCLLISYGTTIFATLNFDKKIQGVIIMPSIINSFENVFDRCELIKKSKLTLSSSSFGIDTNSSLNSGYYHMLNGTILNIINYANEKFGIKDVIICGGNAASMMNINLKCNINLDDTKKDIVILGIMRIISDLKINI